MPAVSEAAYYERKFTRDPLWSSPGPNADETARWLAIQTELAALPPVPEVRLLDVGCGRGWLTHLASAFGQAEGMEPVPEVASHARRLFPSLRFHAATLPELLASPHFRPFDAVLCSEVIEHVPGREKPGFARCLFDALSPGGSLILTTPRRELLERWRRLRRLLPARMRGEPDQPVEEPLTEHELRRLLQRTGFQIRAHSRAYVKNRALSPVNAILGMKTVESALSNRGLESLGRFFRYRWAVYQVWRAERPRAEP